MESNILGKTSETQSTILWEMLGIARPDVQLKIIAIILHCEIMNAH